MGSSASQIPSDYYSSCHPMLTDTTYHRPSDTLYTNLKPQPMVKQWLELLTAINDPKKNLPKHILVPQISIIQPNVPMCSGSNQQPKPLSVLVQYQPFIYCLSKEIHARSLSNTPFLESELWRLLKILTQAIKEWQVLGLKPSSLPPFTSEDVVLTAEGRVCLATPISFIKSYSSPSFHPLEIAPLYCAGVVLLQSASLSLFQEPEEMEKELITFKQNTKYSSQIRTIIGEMITDQNASYNLIDYIMIAINRCNKKNK